MLKLYTLKVCQRLITVVGQVSGWITVAADCVYMGVP